MLRLRVCHTGAGSHFAATATRCGADGDAMAAILGMPGLPCDAKVKDLGQWCAISLHTLPSRVGDGYLNEGVDVDVRGGDAHVVKRGDGWPRSEIPTFSATSPLE